MMQREQPARPRPEGTLIGVLDWRETDEHVRRWRVYQGPRRNNIRVQLGDRSLVCGWDKLYSGLREHFSVNTRQIV